MPVIDERSQPNLYEQVKDRNLQSQWFLLETIFEYSVNAVSFKFSPDIVYSLHFAASTFLTHNPGRIREGHVHIHGSEHVPPDPHEVSKLVFDLCQYLNGRENPGASPLHLCAYAMWKLTWIHPFNECNGRTARALAYLVYCHEKQRWLKGKKTLHEAIRESDKGYYIGLRIADESFKTSGVADLSVLEDYLRRIFHLQFRSEFDGEK